MKNLLFLGFILLTISCTKQIVQIPVLPESGIHKITNHSEVWMFFEVKNNDTIANINRKNTISTTHWIFNIDKHLPLKLIVPSIQSLQYKHANSIHSKKGMHNYFSFSDTISKKLSFIEFDHVIYKMDSLVSKKEVEINNKKYANFNNIHLEFHKNSILMNHQRIEKTTFKKKILEHLKHTSDDKKTMLHLNFDKNLSYQDYLLFKTTIFNICNDQILTNPLEFIFDSNLISASN